MNRNYQAIALALALTFMYGMASGVYQIFPFPQFQAVKHAISPPPVEHGVEADNYEYDWDADPIGTAFYRKVPPFLDNIIGRYEERRAYDTSDFPLPPEQHAEFRARVVDALVRSMTGDGGDGRDWVVSTEAKRSPVIRRFDVQEVDVVAVEGMDIHLYAFRIHDTGDVVPVAACFPDAVPAPAVVAFSGHTHFGLRELFIDRDSYQRAIALALCQDGFATVAVEKIDAGIASRLFQQLGERWRADFWADDEFEAATTILGYDDYWIAGRQLMANIAAIEWLAADERVDHRRMGAAGVSLGGWMTLHAALVNSRLRAVANFGGMWSYLEQYADDRDFTGFEGINDYSQLFPGIFRLGDQNRFVLAAAPVVTLTGYGAEDYPYTTFTRFFHPVIARQYEALGAADSFEMHVHEGGHTMPTDAVREFFERRLELKLER